MVAFSGQIDKRSAKAWLLMVVGIGLKGWNPKEHLEELNFSSVGTILVEVDWLDLECKEVSSSQVYLPLISHLNYYFSLNLFFTKPHKSSGDSTGEEHFDVIARDQTRYRTPSPPLFANLENMEEDENTPSRDREAELQELEGKREVVRSKMKEYHRRLALAYDKHIRPRVFLEGDLVLKISRRSNKEDVFAKMGSQMGGKMSLPKWAPKWEGPYIVSEVHPNGHRILVDPDHGTTIGLINFKYVKQYYA
ncbi:hypothetical protein Ahy_B05g079356 [Arachis hypogaea]|uniref:Uncharacterized protein n=1 Tax=Arachis hypogaea TaxID=3818 RepID=A0A444Z9T8_ARAHY|nr:hypothetical protein Ahy_B05g079356 [Arachis hypogaea]